MILKSLKNILLFNKLTKKGSGLFVPLLKTGSMDCGLCTIQLNIESHEALGRCSNHSEKYVIQDFANEVQSGDTVWDVGANIGTYSIVAALLGADVHAFEPGEDACEEFRSNCSLNNVGPTLHEFALGNKNTDQFFQETSRTGNQHLSTDETDTLVPVRRGDDLDIPQPDILKIDVEGAEQLVINGMINCLDNTRVSYIELHDSREGFEPGSDVSHIKNTLKTKGFEISETKSSKNIIKAKRS